MLGDFYEAGDGQCDGCYICTWNKVLLIATSLYRWNEPWTILGVSVWSRCVVRLHKAWNVKVSKNDSQDDDQLPEEGDGRGD